MVNSAQVTGRRTLHFNSYEDLLADVHAMQTSRKRALGNWSLGQVCEHLAKAIEYAIDGAPFRAPWVFRTLGPWIKKRFIARLEKAIQRWRQCRDAKPHAIFGPMTREEYDQLNFRHAEMHLSFIVPE